MTSPSTPKPLRVLTRSRVLYTKSPTDNSFCSTFKRDTLQHVSSRFHTNPVQRLSLLLKRTHSPLNTPDKPDTVTILSHISVIRPNDTTTFTFGMILTFLLAMMLRCYSYDEYTEDTTLGGEITYAANPT